MNIPIVSYESVSCAGFNTTDAVKNILAEKRFFSKDLPINTGLESNPLCGTIDYNSPLLEKYTKIKNHSLILSLYLIENALNKLNKEILNKRTVLIFGATVGGIRETEELYKHYLFTNELVKKYEEKFHFHEPTAIAGYIAQRFNIKNVYTYSTACSTSIHTLGIAKKMIEQNICDVAISLAVDPLSVLTIRGFDSLKLIDYEGCKPFDKNRIGITLGEGGAAVVSTSEEISEKYDIKPKAFIKGWGTSSDAYHMTAPHPEGEGAYNAMCNALQDANIPPESADYIIAHGTGTPDNDKSEALAIKKLFGEKIPPFTSLKGYVGHTLAASGILETVYGIELMNKNIIPKTIGYENSDPEIGISPADKTEKNINIFIKNAFGFGGNNGSIIISKD